MSRTLQLGISDEVLNTKKLLELFCAGALTIPTDDVAAVVEWLENQETLLPIFDPTMYMKVAGNLPDHLAVAQAFLTFRRALDRVLRQ